MRARLNLLMQQIPSQEAETETALARTDEEEIDRVDDLRARNMDGDGAEIFRQAVPDKDDAEVEKEPEFLVGYFQAD